MLLRFDPFRELDRLTQQAFGSLAVPSSMPMDAYRDGDHVTVHLDLPGVDPSSIDLTVEKNVLTVSAERRWERSEEQDVLVAERPQGHFTRQLFLGEGLDPERTEASYHDGVLTVRVPIAEEARPRRIAITTGSADGAGAEPRQIESVAA